MREINKLLYFLEKEITIKEFIKKVGYVKNQVENRYFISPKDSLFKAVSIMSNKDKITWVGITLNECMPFNTFIEKFGSDFEKEYNYYDEETILIFKGNKFKIYCFIESYVSLEQIRNSKINRLRLSVSE
ncbi:MAG: hypothetical protein N4A49_06195 [Marinifilaceae bacterium]|jgi:hypothetical protein|nr:hypothetical protein [Marinifilaceae bacterium]